MMWKKHGKFIATILLLAVSLAILGIAVYLMFTRGDIYTYVLLGIGAVCVGLWADEFIYRLRMMWRSERRAKMADLIRRADVLALLPTDDTVLPKPSALRAAVEALPGADREWISVEAALPPNDDYVLVVASGRPPDTNIVCEDAVLLASHDRDGWFFEEFPEWDDASVTHWMTIPDTPKEVERRNEPQTSNRPRGQEAEVHSRHPGEAKDAI